MSGARLILSAPERAVLADLVSQFLEVLQENSAANDPALARLSPSAYPDDAEASREFRRLTEADGVARRRADAEQVVDALDRANHAAPDGPTAIPLDSHTLPAWMRTLAALRLVLATRLGIATGGPGSPAARGATPGADNPVLGVYEWLGHQLEQITSVD